MRDVQAYFGDKAHAYRRSATHGNRDELARMLEWLAPRPGERALDVATGGGHTALALAEAGCATVAVDATPAMIRDHPPLPRAVCDAERLPFRRSSFDVVASRIAPHHFPDLMLFAQEAARVLRPQGRLYVFDLTTPADPAQARVIDHVERLRDPSHGHSWSPEEWRAALDKAGLVVERLVGTSSTFELELWIARARMPAEREAELRRILGARPDLSGYGLVDEGKMRVLRVELLARAG
ncbi:MAG TPA: methyltransferase domain-containing protein [Candidatus Thermoplasmatota archaeon]|nr:methyltransferase domain-containing protein [Candidatus Thermoplasmatota archaeon]